MKIRKKTFVSFLSIAVLSLSLLAGCGGRDEEASSPASSGPAVADQTLNIIGYDYTSLDPSVVSEKASFTAIGNIGEGLFRQVSKDGKTVNELAGADKMTVSDDKTVYTFHIRDSQWSDGKPVTADDYVTSWRRLADPKVSKGYLSFLDEIGVKGATPTGVDNPEDLGVKALDDKTFQVTLKAPNPYFESTLVFKALYPVREDKVKELGSQFGIDYKNMVYNGPFIISDYEKGSKIIYKKNDKYWDAKNIKLETANAIVVNEPATYNKMFDSKKLDVIFGVGDFIKPLEDRANAGEIQEMKSNDPRVNYYIFNTKNKFLSNSKVRLAISLAYNRETQLDAVWKTNTVAYGNVPQGILVGQDEYRQKVPEPLKAVQEDPKALLTEGLKELGADPDPSQINLKLLLTQQNSTLSAQAQYIQSQLKQNLGINLTISFAVDNPSYIRSRSAGEFDICAGSWGADYNDAISRSSISSPRTIRTTAGNTAIRSMTGLWPRQKRRWTTARGWRSSSSWNRSSMLRTPPFPHTPIRRSVLLRRITSRAYLSLSSVPITTSETSPFPENSKFRQSTWMLRQIPLSAAAALWGKTGCMVKYILKRIGFMVITLWVIATITFVLINAIPGDPISAASDRILDKSVVEMIRKQYQLDQPEYVRYTTYLSHLVRGDMGVSIYYQGKRVNDIIAQEFPVSARLGIQAVLIGLLFGLLLGIVAALKRNTWADYLVIFLALAGICVPGFVLAILLQYWFGAKFGLSTAGWSTKNLYEIYRYSLLPSLALAAQGIASNARFMRTSVLEIINQDYILTAQSKGVRQAVLVWKHIVRNAAIPIVTLTGPRIAGVLTGSIVIEGIFSIPGLGRELIDAISNRDYTVVMSLTVFYAFLYVVSLLLVDIAYVLIDPRIKLSKRKDKKGYA